MQTPNLYSSSGFIYQTLRGIIVRNFATDSNGIFNSASLFPHSVQ